MLKVEIVFAFGRKEGQRGDVGARVNPITCIQFRTVIETMRASWENAG